MIVRRAMRAALAVVVGATMAAASVAGGQTDLEPGGTFVDDDGNVHEGYIEAIADRGVTRGCNPPDNDRYCPPDPVTRGQMAAFLARSLDLAPSEEDPFDDDDGHVFENDIESLAAAGITRGCNPPDNDRYCPDDPVTRAQMAAFLARGFGYTDRGEGDLFQDDEGLVFEADIERIGAAGVTRGCNPPDNDRYCPHDPVQRDQMASFLGRSLGLEPRTPPPTMAVAPYFFLDEEGHPGRTGPFLAPFHRRVPESPAIAEAALEALLDGPTADEGASVPSVLTDIPAGTELRSVAVADGLATVDLSAEFAAGEPTVSAARRAAQVVFTLTRFDTVDRVAFRQDGAAVEVQTDNGALVAEPVRRADYLDFQASVSVEEPTYGGPAGASLQVGGVARVFEATFEFALTDADGVVIAEGVAMSGSGVTWAPFEFTVEYDVGRSQRGALIVWASSARDGSRVDIREYPVYLVP